MASCDELCYLYELKEMLVAEVVLIYASIGYTRVYMHKYFGVSRRDLDRRRNHPIDKNFKSPNRQTRRRVTSIVNLSTCMYKVPLPPAEHFDFPLVHTKSPNAMLISW